MREADLPASCPTRVTAGPHNAGGDYTSFDGSDDFLVAGSTHAAADVTGGLGVRDSSFTAMAWVRSPRTYSGGVGAHAHDAVTATETAGWRVGTHTVFGTDVKRSYLDVTTFTDVAAFPGESPAGAAMCVDRLPQMLDQTAKLSSSRSGNVF